MFNPLAVREGKRNLDAMYKSRFERAEQQRFQMELQLNIINFYTSVVENSQLHIVEATGSNGEENMQGTAAAEIVSRLSQLDKLVQEIQNLIEAMSSTSTRKDGLTSADIEECEALSRLDYENLDYQPSKIPVTSLAMLFDPFHLTYLNTDSNELKPGCFITCDSRCLTHIINAAKNIFPTPGLVSIAYDRTESKLTMRLRDSADHGGLAHLFDQVENILAGQVVPLPYENITMLFIAKCLSRSIGGDVTLDGIETVISLVVSLDCGDGPAPAALPKENQPLAEKLVPVPLPVPMPIHVPPASVSSSSEYNDKNSTPLSAETPPPLVVTQRDALGGRKLNILLVEDNKTLQSVFKRWWEKREHNVFIAKDGQEAVNMFKEQNYSIVFSDIEIPIKDGFAVTREIRAFEAERNRKQTPIIGLSGNERGSYAERALQSGMNDFTSKGSSFQMTKIYDIVVKYCA